MRGSDTLPVFFEVADLLQQWIPEIDTVSIPCASHDLPGRNPAAVATGLVEFFTKNDLRASLSSVSALASSHSEPRPAASRDVRSPHTDKPFFEQRTDPAGAAPHEFAFGRFRLLAAQFLLLEGDKPVPIGSRALEILIVLLDRAGELVSKQELMAEVWPNLFVEPANLT